MVGALLAFRLDTAGSIDPAMSAASLQDRIDQVQRSGNASSLRL
jgi:hypothetical protein